MKKNDLAMVIVIIGVTGFMALAGCGGGGGGGGPSKLVTKMYLFGTMSSNTYIASVFSNISAPNFKDYSAPSNTANGVFPLRNGVLAASGPIKMSQVDGTYDTVSKKLRINLVNGVFDNLSSSTTKNSGKGTEIATLIMKLGTTLPAKDNSPIVGKHRDTPLTNDYLNGCRLNYAP